MRVLPIFLLPALLLIFLFSGLASADNQQARPYEPDPTPPMFDPMHFPRQSDQDTWERVKKKLEQYEDKKKDVSDLFGLDGQYWNDDRYKQHPWLPFRNPVESQLDWINDSIAALIKMRLSGEAISGGGGSFDLLHFVKCFEPRPVIKFPNIPFTCTNYCAPWYVRPKYCDAKINTGYLFAYWWPEHEVEVNNFGVASINPLYNAETMREVLLIKMLLVLQHQLLYSVPFNPIDLQMRRFGAPGMNTKWPSGLRKDPNLGQSQFEGQQPGDQWLNLEDHVYQTVMGKWTSDQYDEDKGEWGINWKKTKFGICLPIPFWYNGYKKGNKECFYNTLDEPTPVANMWTEEAMFSPYWRIAENSIVLDDQLYQAAAPMAGVGEPKMMILEGMFPMGSFGQNRSCASYRASRWEDRYGDLETAVGIVPNEFDEGRRLCYRGGGELFPITGQVPAAFSPGSNAAYLTLRGLFLSSREDQNQLNRSNKYSDRADKLQRVSPDPTECFRTDQIDDLDEQLFPPDLLQPGDEQKTSIRYIYWNMRIGCVCQYRGWYPIPNPINLVLPGFIPIGMGCHAYQKTPESLGDLDDQPIAGIGLGLITDAASALFAEAAWQLIPWGAPWPEKLAPGAMQQGG